jgi:hypothetical protein
MYKPTNPPNLIPSDPPPPKKGFGSAKARKMTLRKRGEGNGWGTNVLLYSISSSLLPLPVNKCIYSFVLS